ncbi:MAG TPA: hypothetical protein VMT00_08705 [Thermoanaerobaculia bacterium]|nr:hypothetical protein [Thermoanaerobaculia bacterium]
MNDEQFYDTLRRDSKTLRFVPDDPFLESRLEARISEEIRRPSTAIDLIAAWWLRLASAIGVVALASASLLLYVTIRAPMVDPISSIASMALMSEDYYRVAE